MTLDLRAIDRMPQVDTSKLKSMPRPISWEISHLSLEGENLVVDTDYLVHSGDGKIKDRKKREQIVFKSAEVLPMVNSIAAKLDTDRIKWLGAFEKVKVCAYFDIMQKLQKAREHSTGKVTWAIYEDIENCFLDADCSKLFRVSIFCETAIMLLKKKKEFQDKEIRELLLA